MNITIAGVGDAEVDPGTPLAEIIRELRAPAAVWCGGTRLDQAHRAGVAPLVEGALLSAGPAPSTVPPTGPHLRVIAGPDAGSLIQVSRGEAHLGREGPFALADVRLSRRHLALDARGRVRDLGSANGTQLVRNGHRRRLGAMRRRLRPDDLLLAGETVLRWTDPAVDTSREAPVQSDEARRGRGGARASALAAGLAGGLAGALAWGAATGRWALAAVALAAPVGTMLLASLRGRPAPARTRHGIEELADAPLPLAVRGDPWRARGVARAVAIARRSALPARLDEPWMRWMDARLRDGEVTLASPGAVAPSEARTVVDADAGTIVVDGRERGWRPAVVSSTTADVLARVEAGRRTAALPRAVRWGEVRRPAPDPLRLVATLGIGPAGPVTLDLDADGPHVLIAGTTGSGKSALLETLVAGLAHDQPPSRLGVAMIDLKGGAGLGACADLPHVRGVLTDLDPSAARRALLGLALELRSRKRLHAEARAPSWTAWAGRHRPGEALGPPPRLLVVVDEFQELGALDPGFVPELARIAAQGRAFGMHLVLATQRPSGAVAPDIRANVATVIALRTANAGESHDLLGDGEAATLPADSPGRAIVASPSARLTMQAALPLAAARPRARAVGRPSPAGPTVAEAAAATWVGAPRAEPLWLPPLAAGALAPPGSLGWLDRPEDRTREALRWDPREGPLAVVGPRGSGRSTVIDAVASALPGSVRLPPDPREAARTFALAPVAGITALLIDDADRACAAIEPFTRGVVELLDALSHQVPLVLAGGPAWGARWASRAGVRVVLSGLDRVEQALWGVPAPLLGLTPEPGRGVAITARGAAECRISPAPRAPTRVLVRPLGKGLAPGAVGRIGDDAVPWHPHGAITVVGPPGDARDLIARMLESAGCAVGVGTALGPPDGVDVIVSPTRTRLAELGIAAPPGIAEPNPSPGRVAVRRQDRIDAALIALGARPS